MADRAIAACDIPAVRAALALLAPPMASLMHTSCTKLRNIGLSDTDAFLCHLGRSIGAVLRSLSDCAEASHEELRAMRVTLHSAVDARCDELEAGLSRAESAKNVFT